MSASSGTGERGQVDTPDPRLVAGGLEADGDAERFDPAGREHAAGIARPRQPAAAALRAAGIGRATGTG